VNFSLGFSTILFFIDKWNESEKRIKNLEFERQASQLKLIREQINPHFFFNALNSIYALSISKSEETPRVILLLADIMRYILDSQKHCKQFRSRNFEYQKVHRNPKHSF
jgi:LytS/YehU family sensor histidine kinase